MRTFFLIFAFVLGVTTRPTGEEVVCVEYRSANQPPSKICGYPVSKPDMKGFQPRFSDSRTSEMIPNSMKLEAKNCPHCGNLLPLPYAAGIRDGRTIYVPPVRKEDRTGRSDCLHDIVSMTPITSPITFPSRIIPVQPQFDSLAAAEEMFGRYFHLYDRVKQLEERLKIAENPPKNPEEKNENPKKISSPETLQREGQNPSEPNKK